MAIELGRGVPILRIFDISAARDFYVDCWGSTLRNEERIE